MFEAFSKQRWVNIFNTIWFETWYFYFSVLKCISQPKAFFAYFSKKRSKDMQFHAGLSHWKDFISMLSTSILFNHLSFLALFSESIVSSNSLEHSKYHWEQQWEELSWLVNFVHNGFSCEGGYFWLQRQLINEWTEIKFSLSPPIILIRKYN